MRRERTDDRRLDSVGVLEFVDENVPVLPGIGLDDLFLVLEQARDINNKVVEIDDAVGCLQRLVCIAETLHSVFGRRYRVIRIQDNQAKVVGTVVAKVVPKI